MTDFGLVNNGTSANDDRADSLYVAFQRVNLALIGLTSALGIGGQTDALTLSVATLSAVAKGIINAQTQSDALTAIGAQAAGASYDKASVDAAFLALQGGAPVTANTLGKLSTLIAANTVSQATSASDGLMTAADKVREDSLFDVSTGLFASDTLPFVGNLTAIADLPGTRTPHIAALTITAALRELAASRSNLSTNATQALDGYMAAADKARLDNLFPTAGPAAGKSPVLSADNLLDAGAAGVLSSVDVNQIAHFLGLLAGAGIAITRVGNSLQIASTYVAPVVPVFTNAAQLAAGTAGVIVSPADLVALTPASVTGQAIIALARPTSGSDYRAVGQLVLLQESSAAVSGFTGPSAAGPGVWRCQGSTQIASTGFFSNLWLRIS